jgi:hypothetical protein
MKKKIDFFGDLLYNVIRAAGGEVCPEEVPFEIQKRI